MTALARPRPALAALDYIRRGIPVFPLHNPRPDGNCSCGNLNCKNIGKHPRTRHGLKDASVNEPQIRDWWSRWPDANIGIPTGAPSGIIVLDVDASKGGRESLTNLELEHEPLPRTPYSRTGGGGAHYLFTHPGQEIKNSAGKVGPGLDIRGDGGYIVAPPSLHPSGNYYEWIISLDDEYLADIPGWLLEAMTAESVRPESSRNGHGEITPATGYARYAQSALADECERVARASEGTRNATLNAAAFSLGQLVAARILSRSEVERALEQAARENRMIDDDGYTAFAKTLKSGIEAGMKKPRELPEPKSPTPRNRARKLSEPPENDGGESSLVNEPDAVLLAFDASDEGNALAVRYLYGDEFAYCEAIGWLHYNGRCWNREDAEAKLDRAIVDTLVRRRIVAVKAEKEAIVKASKPSAANVRNCKYLLESHLVLPVSEFDRDPDLLNVANGVLNLKTGELVPHSPTQRFTYCLEVPYNPKADQSLWTEFLAASVAGGPEVVKYIQEAIGYSVTGHTNEEVLFYIVGPSRSGKGTFTEPLLKLFGTPLSDEVDFNTFTRNRDNDANNFDLAPLKPARLIIASESGKYDSLNAAKIKLLTGGNYIRCAFKHRDHFTYRPQFTIWLISNHEIKADPDDDAAWGRVRIIEFPHSHLGNEDKTLKARMKSPAVLEGILAWIVEGARRWYARPRGLETPEAVKLATKRARDDLDTVLQWLNECTRPEPAGYVTNDALYASYSNWCVQNGTKPKTMRHLSQSLKMKGYIPGVQKKISGRNSRCVVGLVLLSAGSAPADDHTVWAQTVEW